MMKRQSRFQRKPKAVAEKCSFCETDTDPDYKDVGVLSRFLTERGKIISRSRTGVCSSHQRSLTTAIKRSRTVALLPFMVRA
ncbi:MAG: 30S ribosomal protein S18 [bacterium]|nr:30S ribosomal protein S18 [bacterium]